MKKSELKQLIREEILNESRLINVANDLADDMFSDLAYQAKERFGGKWPQDVLSSEENKLFWNTIYKRIIELAKKNLK